MKVTMIGTGAPRPDPTRRCTCVLVEIGEQRLLFDLGRGALSGLASKDISAGTIGPVFISHHHLDHIGELGEFIIVSWMEGRRIPLQIYGPPETAAIVDALMTRVYDKDIIFRTLGERGHGDFVPAITTETRAGLVHDGGHYRVFAEEVRHGAGLPFPQDFLDRWICLGFRIEAEGKVVSISGDTVRCDGVLSLARNSDLHIQCCWMPEAKVDSDYIRAVVTHTLPSSEAAGQIAADAGVRKLVLTHFRRMDPSWMPLIADEIRRSFSGEFHLANDLDSFDV